jgi:hypothetical protein
VAASAGLSAGGQQLVVGALGESVRAPRDQHVTGGAQLRVGIDTALRAAEPLAVEEVRAGELGTQLRPTQAIDRFGIRALGGLAFAEQRP